MQNKSHAVMAQRVEPPDSLDDFPTPPWATRALIEYVIGSECRPFTHRNCLEPACGVGHMAKVLAEYFGKVGASDVHDYGYGERRDFLTSPFALDTWDWIITNPPFRLAEEFVFRALEIAREGVAIIARTVFIESVGRYEKLFRPRPPAIYAQFSERVPMLRGRLEKSATTATSYCWLVWEKAQGLEHPKLIWIPPCRKKLERAHDYDTPLPQLPSTHTIVDLGAVGAEKKRIEAAE
jgi:hypothetical protein